MSASASPSAADPTLLAKAWGALIAFSQVPSYHLVLEASLVCWVLWLLIRRASHRGRRAKAEKLTRWGPGNRVLSMSNFKK